jgi:hypothetical protein
LTVLVYRFEGDKFCMARIAAYKEAAVPLRFAEGRCLDLPDGRTLAGLHPRRTTQAITRGDYLHKQNSFLIHGEQANPRTGMPEP